MFVALVPPPGGGRAPRRRSWSRAGRPAPFRWALPEQFHVTLAFLAEVPDRQLDDLVERLARAAQRRTPFETRVAGGGAFPNAGRARVLWAGLDLDETGRTELDRLATGARAAATQGRDRRRRPAVPAARHPGPARPPAEVVALGPAARRLRRPGLDRRPVALVASYLGEGPRSRPRYETVEKFPLGVDRADRHDAEP